MNLKQIISDTVNTNWKDILLQLDTTEIDKFLTKELEIYQNEIKIFPPTNLIFNTFNFTNFKDTKIVLLGQDPYINDGEAMGLCFSIPENIKKPPSLNNIFKEIASDMRIDTSQRNGDLTQWARQGILLLNSSLTVRQYKSNSHKKVWQKYTDSVIRYISDYLENVIFILWGNDARLKKNIIDGEKHFIIEGVHPSPLSANKGFFGCRHFSKCNEILTKLGKKAIEW